MNVVDSLRRTRSSPLLSASLMCAKLTELGPEVSRLEEAGVDSFHVDVMDGHFVPNLTFGLAFVGAIRPLTRLPIHVHLMTDEPERYVESACAAGSDVVFFHLEATRAPLRLAAQVSARGAQPGLAINPATALPELPELMVVPNILVMAVEPGFAGQAHVRSTPRRVASLRRIGYGGMIAVDGNVNEETIPDLWHAGADGFVCGSSGLFTSADADYRERTTALRATVGNQNVAVKAGAR